MIRMNYWRKNRGKLTIMAILMAVAMIFWIGCAQEQQSPVSPDSGEQDIVLKLDDASVQAALTIQEQHTDELMAVEGVVGVATGMTEDGQPAILILTERELQTRALAKSAPLPAEIEGVPVRELVTGEIKALKGGPPGGGGGGFDPTAKHRPAPNGVSLGHFNITAGTLGCLVQNGGNTYILSNNHVMADENQANNNDNILQPGPYDGGSNPGDQIASLSNYVPIVFSTSANNTVDAAIASVNSNDVTGESPDYGPPRTATVAAAVNMRVMKSGRTTGFTKGRVQGINATVNVGYSSGTARFVGQIVIGGGGFSSGGDSGSLIVVEKGGDARKPVGLLFAGGGGTTIANPINNVLSAFGVSIVGN
ncbi:MAG: serine protease [Calditrichaeota bacterium]|nr:serine protease [Calditrichota bacterium]MCB9087367.1 serine protease [Calditrichia bacterium]